MFVKLINTSISASWLILAVIVLRLLWKQIPKAVHCALWGLVAIRLICPFSITSSLSLIPNAETIPENALCMEASAQSNHVAVGIAANPLLPGSAHMEVDTTVGQLQAFDRYGTLIWAAGMVLILLYAMVSYLRLRKKVSASIRTKEDIWICDQVDSPFILGILRPRIYLPSSMEESQWSYVLAHEQAHLKRRDHWWKPLGFVLLAVYWFNPFIWTAYMLLCRDIEMACDEKVVRDMGLQEKKTYAETLLSYSATCRMISACPLAFGEIGVKERVKAVLHYKKPAFWVITFSVVICAVLAVCFLTNPAAESENSGEAVISSVNDTETSSVLRLGSDLSGSVSQTENIGDLSTKITVNFQYEATDNGYSIVGIESAVAESNGQWVYVQREASVDFARIGYSEEGVKASVPVTYQASIGEGLCSYDCIVMIDLSHAVAE
ncbi:MAG: M56 family metallopeptidase [Oscillospiraceae bacterium]